MALLFQAIDTMIESASFVHLNGFSECLLNVA